MVFLDSLCRSYQSCFRHSHPEEARIVELHSTGKMDQFCHEYFEHEYRKGQETVARFSKLATGWQAGAALDFGCGAGGLTYQIARQCSKVVGIDLEQYKLDFAIAQAERLNVHNVQFQCYDGKSLPYADASFDCIFCIDVIEHLPTPERFVAEFLRILKPDGQLLISFGPPWKHAHGKHMWAKLPGWWTHLLFPRPVVMRVAGFAPETTWEQLGMHKLTVAKFERIMEQSGFIQTYYKTRINSLVHPLKYIPWIRELFIGEVVAVFKKTL